jgi:large subunit ribosomal protein L3
MTMLLGKKVGQTQVFDEKGKLLPVTVIQAGPCTVMQVKTIETDGYQAVQLGYDDVKPARRTKPAVGHAKKANTPPKKFVREMRLANGAKCDLKTGDKMTVSVFEKTKNVDIIGTSKGKGYAGVMKRHHFGGMSASHGTERMHRHGGSISSYGTDRGHGGDIKKGKRMSGHLGDVRVTKKNQKVISIDTDNNLIVVKGSVPGAAGGYVIIRSSQKN